MGYWPLALFLIGGLLMADSNAQKRKRKRRPSSPQITNPEIYQPAQTDNTNSNNSGRLDCEPFTNSRSGVDEEDY